MCKTYSNTEKQEIYKVDSIRSGNLPEKQEIYKIDNIRSGNLTLHLKKLEKAKQTKSKVSIRKEIIKIKAEIYEIKTTKR